MVSAGSWMTFTIITFTQGLPWHSQTVRYLSERYGGAIIRAGPAVSCLDSRPLQPQRPPLLMLLASQTSVQLSYTPHIKTPPFLEVPNGGDPHVLGCPPAGQKRILPVFGESPSFTLVIAWDLWPLKWIRCFSGALGKVHSRVTRAI